MYLHRGSMTLLDADDGAMSDEMIDVLPFRDEEPSPSRENGSPIPLN